MLGFFFASCEKLPGGNVGGWSKKNPSGVLVSFTVPSGDYRYFDFPSGTIIILIICFI